MTGTNKTDTPGAIPPLAHWSHCLDFHRQSSLVSGGGSMRSTERQPGSVRCQGDQLFPSACSFLCTWSSWLSGIRSIRSVEWPGLFDTPPVAKTGLSNPVRLQPVSEPDGVFVPGNRPVDFRDQG